MSEVNMMRVYPIISAENIMEAVRKGATNLTIPENVNLETLGDEYQAQDGVNDDELLNDDEEDRTYASYLNEKQRTKHNHAKRRVKYRKQVKKNKKLIGFGKMTEESKPYKGVTALEMGSSSAKFLRKKLEIRKAQLADTKSGVDYLTLLTEEQAYERKAAEEFEKLLKSKRIQKKAEANKKLAETDLMRFIQQAARTYDPDTWDAIITTMATDMAFLTETE